MSPTIYIITAIFFGLCLAGSVASFLSFKYGRKATAKSTQKTLLTKVGDGILKDKESRLKLAKAILKSAKRGCFVINKKHTVQSLTEKNIDNKRKQRKLDIKNSQLKYFELKNDIKQNVPQKKIDKVIRKKEKLERKIDAPIFASNEYTREIESFEDFRTGINSLKEETMKEFKEYVEKNYSEIKAKPYAKVVELSYNPDSGLLPTRVSSAHPECLKKGQELLMEEAKNYPENCWPIKVKTIIAKPLAKPKEVTFQNYEAYQDYINENSAGKNFDGTI